jgi:hypothetical protein
MTEFQRPADWTDEQSNAYFGTADDPMEDEPEAIEAPDLLDLYALYDPATAEGGDDEGTLA